MSCALPPRRLRLRAQGLGIASLLLPALAGAYSVGEADLVSRYAEDLAVNVPLTLGSEAEARDAAEISARLLPLAAYGSLGLVTPPLPPEAVDIRVTGSGLSYQVELRSRHRVREPFLTLMLEVRIGNVRVLRELPLIFDLPAQDTRLAAAEPRAGDEAVQPEPAVAPAAMPAAPAPLQPAVAAEPAEKTAAPRPRARGSKRREAEKAARTPPRTPMFRLADWNPEYRAQLPLPRFQLAQSFDSYARLAAAGQAPPPAAENLPLPATPGTPATPPAGEARPAAVVSAPSPAAAPAQTGASWLMRGLIAGALLAAGWLLLRRRRSGPAAPQVAAAQQPMVSAQASDPTAETPPLAAEACARPPESAHVPASEAVSPPLAAAAALPAAPSSAEDAVAELRRRVAEILGRTMDANHRRKLQLVEAYVDLGRIVSAQTLLAELESDLVPKPSTRLPFTLIKG